MSFRTQIFFSPDFYKGNRVCLPTREGRGEMSSEEKGSEINGKEEEGSGADAEELCV